MVGRGLKVLRMVPGTHGAAIPGASTGLGVSPLWVSTDIPMAITCPMPVEIALGRFGLRMPSATDPGFVKELFPGNFAAIRASITLGSAEPTVVASPCGKTAGAFWVSTS